MGEYLTGDAKDEYDFSTRNNGHQADLRSGLKLFSRLLNYGKRENSRSGGIPSVIVGALEFRRIIFSGGDHLRGKVTQIGAGLLLGSTL